MKKLVQVVWSSASITMIALAVVISGVVSTQSVNAQENKTITDDNPVNIEREQNAANDNSKNSIRIQQRAEMEAKKQELKAAQEAAKAQLEADRAANRAARQEKLSASKLEICKAREANINNRIARIADRSAKHLALFNQISERAQTYNLNNSHTVANYEELLADVEAKKAAAETAVATITATTANFSCDGENPKLAVEEFKISLKSSVEVLKDYRTSVKNLIAGIKAAEPASTNNSTQNESIQ